MGNVEINVRVNGKDVPLSTISTETFERIKDGEKIKELLAPIMIGNYRFNNSPRVFIQTKYLREALESAFVGASEVLVFERNGNCCNWLLEKALIEKLADELDEYENVQPL